MRPDTLSPCPALKQYKGNIICETCHLLGKGGKQWVASEIAQIVDEGWLPTGPSPKKKNRDLPRVDCKWPHGKCPNKAQVRGETAGMYCQRHTYILKHRKKVGWPDERLFDPVRE
jgi:hypothetical protein